MKHILPAFYIIAVLILSPVKVISQVTFSGPELLCRPTSNSVTINIVPDADISQLLYEYGTTSGIYTGQTPVYSVTAGVPLLLLFQACNQTPGIITVCGIALTEAPTG